MASYAVAAFLSVGVLRQRFAFSGGPIAEIVSDVARRSIMTAPPGAKRNGITVLPVNDDTEIVFQAP